MHPMSGSTSTTGAGGAPKMHRMVTSCNGCRALRKGCSDDCTIRPCLQWIKNPEAQGNATHFLAKFYGRAGLLNLIAAAPTDADGCQAVFRSLLYEACGRIINPVYGAVGLLWTKQWQKCVDAVEAVFKGKLGVPVDVVQDDAVSSEAAAAPPPPLGARPGASSSAAYDIRHFAKNSDAAAAADLLRFARAGHTGFKRGKDSSSYASKAKLLKGKGKVNNNVRASPRPPLGQQQEAAKELEPVPMVMELLDHNSGRNEEFAVSHDHHLKLKGSQENTDVEAAASHVIQAVAEPPLGNQVLAVADPAIKSCGAS